MAQPVTPHEHIVAQAARQQAQRDAARALRHEILAAKEAERDASIRATLNDAEDEKWRSS